MAQLHHPAMQEPGATTDAHGQRYPFLHPPATRSVSICRFLKISLKGITERGAWRSYASEFWDRKNGRKSTSSNKMIRMARGEPTIPNRACVACRVRSLALARTQARAIPLSQEHAYTHRSINTNRTPQRHCTSRRSYQRHIQPIFP